jgi:predicted molibdopterin-dependent oxidoreductase YjgC
VFGAGGGTSSYREVEETDLLILWGSNARETHPIFFHHVLKAVHRGASLHVIDPRRTGSAQWADTWLGLDVGSDIALANTIAREIIHAGLANEAFISRATSGFAEYRASVEHWTLEEGERVTGVPAQTIRELAHAYARAERAILCWTLGITEHVTGVDNVLSLINLALLTGHVGRYGSGLNPLRGQNNVQGGGDMGAIPNKLPGFQDVQDDHARARFEAAWGTKLAPKYGWHLSQMFEAMERGELNTLYVLGENPAQSEADSKKSLALLEGLDFMIAQDIIMTKTCDMADVVFPSSASWCEADGGTVTNSERRVQRMRKALDPPGLARDDHWIIGELARRLGHDWGQPSLEQAWEELRSLSPMHRGMSYARLEETGGLQWPCPSEDHPGSLFLHGRLWQEPVQGPPAPFSITTWAPPVDELSEDFPIRLTTGRRLDSYNTGVQTNLYSSPLRRGETLDLCPEDAASLGVEPDEIVRISSRRGSIEAPVRLESALRPGLAFMTIHFGDDVDVNMLTTDSADPKAGTAEFKATAIRIEKRDREDRQAAGMASGEAGR